MTEPTGGASRAQFAAVPAVALQFVLELCALAALAYWGYHAGANTAKSIALAAAAVGTAIAFWALFGSPKAAHRARGARRVIVQIVFFGAAGLALWSVDSGTLAAGFVAIAAVNITILRMTGNDG